MSCQALSVDLEEHFQVSNFEGLIDRGAWDAQPSRVADSARRLLQLFDETGSRATFFVLGWVAERQPALVREIAARGHEIACHGYGHEIIYEIGPERFREDLKRAREATEAAAGVRVKGYRAPSFSITERSLWALEILAEEGFDYDSSIFPIRHYRYGIPGFARDPVRIDLGQGRSIREFPLTTLQLGRFVLPLAGGAYLRLMPGGVFRWAFSRKASRGRPTVLYTHPWEIDPDQPPQPVPWWVRVNHYANLGRTEARLRALLSRFRFVPMGEGLAGLERGNALPSRPLAALGVG
jgi:polysaccharide deacetylase family protein (PEP-CTERM system associated)